MRKFLLVIFSGFICIQLSGCSGWAMRASSSRQLRVDQQISGNRGFIVGKSTSAPKNLALKDRRVYKVEVELPDVLPRKSIVSADARPKTEDKDVWGNKGYILGGRGSKTPQEAPKARTWKSEGEPGEGLRQEEKTQIALPQPAQVTRMRTYVVNKGDTLQKISLKFYRTSKKWPLLYNANKDNLKSADKVYPGQVLVIPEVGEFKK